MRRIVTNVLPVLTLLIGLFALGATPAKAQIIVNSPNAAAMEASCTGYTALQFTATGLQPSTSYTAAVTVTSTCPGSTTPTIKIINVSFTTPATVTGLTGGPAFNTTDFIQVGNTSCVQVLINANTYCDNNPGLPINTPGVQNYSTAPDGGINGPLALNADDQSTNNGCQVSSTITIVGGWDRRSP